MWFHLNNNKNANNPRPGGSSSKNKTSKVLKKQTTPFYSLSVEQRKSLLKRSAERFNRDFGSAIKQLANE